MLLNGLSSSSSVSTPTSTNGTNTPLPQTTHFEETNTSESIREVCRRINTKLKAFLATSAETERLVSVQEQTRVSLKVIAKAVEVYGLEHLALSFNGGKDCLVLLILYLAVLDEYFSLHTDADTNSFKTSESTFTAKSAYPSIPEDVITASTAPSLPIPTTTNTPTSLQPSSISFSTFKIHTVYVHSTHPFAEVDLFVETCIKTYHLSLSRYDEGTGMKSAFKSYLSANPSTKAIFVGTRRTDPHGGSLTHFDKTDHGWPDFMRIHPVVEWGYGDVWGFLRELDIPYCPLYDLGYTSLGGTRDTHPNPALQRVEVIEGGQDNGDEEGNVNGGEEGRQKRKDSVTVTFRPAYELVDGHEERLGRERR